MSFHTNVTAKFAKLKHSSHIAALSPHFTLSYFLCGSEQNALLTHKVIRNTNDQYTTDRQVLMVNHAWIFHCFAHRFCWWGLHVLQRFEIQTFRRNQLRKRACIRHSFGHFTSLPSLQCTVIKRNSKPSRVSQRSRGEIRNHHTAKSPSCKIGALGPAAASFVLIITEIKLYLLLCCAIPLFRALKQT